MILSKTYLFLLVLILVAGCKLEEPAMPVAKFTVAGADCTGPCTVTFTDASENTSVYDWTYAWDFGDGEKSEAKSPAHMYQNGGNYTVTLKLTGKYGTASDTAMVVIKGKPAEKPEAKFTTTGGNCEAPCEVSFTNTSKNAITFIWNFGDKSTDSLSSDPDTKHTFKTAGVFKVMLIATGAGGSDSTSEMVTIKTMAPLLADFTMKLDTTKKDSTTVTFTNKSTGAVKFDWDFNDKSAVVNDKDPVHKYKRYDEDSTYTIVLKAYDSKGVTKTKNSMLTIKRK